MRLNVSIKFLHSNNRIIHDENLHPCVPIDMTDDLLGHKRIGLNYSTCSD